LLARRNPDGTWLSGSVNLPTAIPKVVDGEFSLVALGVHQLGMISVKEGNVFGIKPFLRMFGADVGDVLVIVFDPKSRRCESWLGGNELAALTQSGPDAIMSYLTSTNSEEMPE
jgi:hypothetical protein